MEIPRRLDKFLSDAGVGSRSRIRALHEAGAISVDGDTAPPLWSLVDPDTVEVRVDHERVSPKRPTRYALLHKPAGLLTAMSDHGDRPTVADLIPEAWRDHVGPIGRLDKPTTGALLITDDGDLSQLLTQPTHKVWKRYEVTLPHPLTPADPRLTRLREGIPLDGVLTLPARAGLLDGGAPGLWLALQEGRKRQVRKMIRALGLRLLHLHRSHIGPLALDPLPEGRWRPLDEDEIHALYDAAGGRDAPRRRAEAALARKLDTDTLDPRERALIEAYLARCSRTLNQNPPCANPERDAT